MVELNFTSSLNFLMPLFSFLFVFIIIYALLIKTKLLGDNKGIHLFISLLLAIFFVVNLDMRAYLQFSGAWMAVFIVCLFLIILLITFTHGKVDMIMNEYVAWGILIILLFFVISSTYFFSWSFQWTSVSNWFGTEWFGFVLLLVIAGVVSWVLAKK